jgi:hypothetical protein
MVAAGYESAMRAHIIVIFVAIAATPGALRAADWEQLLEDDGITVYSRETPGSSLPTFRGETMINGSLLDILAVFQDVPHHTSWMYACLESTIVKRHSEVEALVYNKIDVPWPLNDRDVVLHAKLTYDLDEREAWNRFRSVETPLKSPAPDVVRVPRLEGFFHMVAITPEMTAIVYQVESHPGGMIPDWLAAIASRRLPLNTLSLLRERVAVTRRKGTYRDLIADWIRRYEIPVPGGANGSGGETQVSTANP